MVVLADENHSGIFGFGKKIANRGLSLSDEM